MYFLVNASWRSFYIRTTIIRPFRAGSAGGASVGFSRVVRAIFHQRIFRRDRRGGDIPANTRDGFILHLSRKVGILLRVDSGVMAAAEV